MELHELQTQHGWYASGQIHSFIASLGPFFQKYIERGLARIDAELSTTKQIPHGASMSVHEYKERLTQLRSQMFGCNTINGSPKQQEENDGSPVRNRLDSPAYKFARTTSSAHGSPLSPGKKVVDLPPPQDATIKSLRERLARLKNTE